jgi:hypothetical protein
MQLVSLYCRSYALGNCAVLLAVLGVFATVKGWSDLLVAVVMGGVALRGAWLDNRTSLRELDGLRA